MAEVDPIRIVELLEDEYARGILVAASDEPMSASELSDACDASPPTIYRRLDALESAGLVEQQTLPDSEGHHYTIYRATLESVTITVDGDGLTADVTTEESVADRFTRLYEELR